MASSAYANVRAAIADEGSDARVEVNQRALIDKILARYASAGAVYRELLQNSNDAEATTAEIIITTSANKENDAGDASSTATSGSSKEVVTQVIYRNNGLPFRPQDWARLRKIAEGNPDETKVGAFGVGAYTMFSICEEPLVVSGTKGSEEAMAFFWKGDGLWTKTGKAPEGIVNMSASLTGTPDNDHWTSFILPSRDPYPLPDLVEFGQFLTASLTFTQCLRSVRVYVNNTLQMNIEKSILESHTIETPRASSWWKNDGAATSSSTGMFAFGRGSDLIQTSVQMTVSLRRGLSPTSDMETSAVRARYASASVKTSIPPNIEKRMVRVTKKKPPKELTVQIFLDAADETDGGDDDDGKHSSKRKAMPKLRKSNNKQCRATQITDAFAPAPGSGRIFIGFRTSQTTGLGIHLAAPLLPTVEREAIDFVDAALREYNAELLEISGMLMRLALEHEMGRIGTLWDGGKEERARWEVEKKERSEEEKRKKEKEEEEREAKKEEETEESTSISSSLFSFATFMARGVKNTVTEAIKPVAEIVGADDESAELLNPADDRPLCMEERDAILLMRAYCPRPSTPDSLVGQCLARGFARCLPSSAPPVLTAGGVVRGSDAKLPNHGMEAFGFPNVVRRIMLENAKEYHSLIAGVPTLTIDDLVRSLRDQVLEEKMLVRLLKWWPKVCRVERSMERRGLRLKEAIKFEAATMATATSNSGKTNKASSGEAQEEVETVPVQRLESILYYTPNKLMDGLPLPETSFPPPLQKEIGLRILENGVYHHWFSALPFDIWASFVASHECMSQGRPEDINIKVLAALSKHFDSLEGAGPKRRFVELLPKDSPCILFDIEGGDGNTPSASKTAPPKDLYLPSSDLTAFAGVGVFHKVSKRLTKAGVSDAFLLAMGVRTTISIDFLFLHLDTLTWNTNPAPLIKYLLEADLSPSDLVKLRSTQYLPAEGDESHVYAPSELYLKDAKLETFPFVKFLQWPTSEGMSKKHRDFLIKLGVRVDVPLASVMNFLDGECKKDEGARDDKVYSAALQYLTQRLGPQGLYEREFSRYRTMKFLPCIRQNLETGDVIKEMQSPTACYYNPSALVMGFSTLDPQLETVHIATRTKCSKDPSTSILIKRLIQLVDISKAKIDHFEKNVGNNDEERKKLREKLLTLFEAVFLYMASRTSDFEKRDVTLLSKKAFIPCVSRNQVVFYLPSQVFFKKESSSTEGTLSDDHDALTETLFQQIKYNAFLSLVGVKAEPSLQEIFDLMIEKPDEVLDTLGEDKYKMLLRRIASDPPFRHITKQIRSCPFLLGYLVIDEEIDSEDEKEQKAQYVLARAEDIYLVDNSFLRRQFPMLVSPMEQTLEEFYNKVGSKYVSEVVKKDFQVQGNTYHNTALTKSFASRIRERKPLLLSPSNSSRPLLPNAAKVLDDRLEIVQADKIQARYSFEGSSKHLKVTCCSKQRNRQHTTIYITTNPDWFDIGSAIGALILQRCQLEDALLLSQLLESPLQTLRYRGFPVDRILRPVSKPQPPPPPQTQTQTQPDKIKSAPPEEANGGASKGTSQNTNGHGPQPETTDDGFASILKQMFPTCPLDVIQGLLGPEPTKEKAREVANLLSTKVNSMGDEAKVHSGSKNEIRQESQKPPEPPQKSPDDDCATCATQDSENGQDENNSTLKEEKQKKKKSSGLMGKMLKGFHSHGNGGKRIIQDQGQNFSHTANSNTPSSPENDASTQNSLESMLNQAVQSSRSVDNAGVRSPETLLQSLPQGLERGSNGCEVIPAQNIQPFQGPHGNYKTRNGVKVFSAASSAPSFLSQNFNAVERFSIVIQNLANVYKLHVRTVAIYYEPTGNTIAFNSNKALYFNFRFFCALHKNNIDSSCYSYWYMTFAHELAHNLVTAHNKEHGSFTESIAALYLPDFVKLLSQIS